MKGFFWGGEDLFNQVKNQRLFVNMSVCFVCETGYKILSNQNINLYFHSSKPLQFKLFGKPLITFAIINRIIFFFFALNVDINECLEPDACGLNAICQNLPGNYTCGCLQGFEGNPYDRVSSSIHFRLGTQQKLQSREKIN